MKVGDNLSVSMEGFEVTSAVIEDISDGKATILIPATRIVMGVKQSLVDLEPDNDSVQREWAALAETGGDTASDASKQQAAEAEEERKAAASNEPVENEQSLSSQNLDSSAIDD